MGEATPAISVIVPMYNVAPFVGECLQSLLDQEFGDFEAICVNDGSTDGTLERAREVVGDDARFSFITVENGGQSRARNIGMDRARGEYLAFLDSDDYFLPHSLGRMHEVTQVDGLDYLDFTAHTFYETERARELRNEDYYETRPDIPGVMSGPQLFVKYQQHVEYHCAPWLHFVKRSLVEDAGLRFTEGIIHEDELFSPLLIAHAKRARYLNEVLYWRRMREGSSITTTQGMRSTVFMLQAAEGLHSWLRENWRDYDDAFIDAMAQRVHELRGLAVGYAQKASPADLAAHARRLQGDDLIDFDLTIVGGLRDAEKAERALARERLYYPRRAWHAARAVAGAAGRAASNLSRGNRFPPGKPVSSGETGSAGLTSSDQLPPRKSTSSEETGLPRGDRPFADEPTSSGETDLLRGNQFPPGKSVSSGETGLLGGERSGDESARPRVSVIVAAYNEEAHIGQCIESLRAQTLKDFEVICVDDGSTDDTARIVRDLAAKDGRIRLLQQRNAGPGVARNAGLAQARGEFVYCLDADDFARRDLLQACVKALDDTGADMALFAFRIYNDQVGRTLPARWGMSAVEAFPLHPRGTFTWRSDPDLFFEAVRNIPWNKMVRRSVLVENDIAFQDLYLTEDAMYSLPAAVCARSIVRLPRPLMFHRELAGTSLMADRGKHPLDFLTAFDTLRTWLQQRGVYDELRLAWQTWLLDAVHYTLPSYTRHEAFVEAFDHLTADGLRAFDLHDLDPERIPNPFHRRMFEALRTGSRERFLLACTNCDLAEMEDRVTTWLKWQTPSGSALEAAKEKLRTGADPLSSAIRTWRS